MKLFFRIQTLKRSSMVYIVESTSDSESYQGNTKLETPVPVRSIKLSYTWAMVSTWMGDH